MRPLLCLIGIFLTAVLSSNSFAALDEQQDTKASAAGMLNAVSLTINDEVTTNSVDAGDITDLINDVEPVVALPVEKPVQQVVQKKEEFKKLEPAKEKLKNENKVIQETKSSEVTRKRETFAPAPKIGLPHP